MLMAALTALLCRVGSARGNLHNVMEYAETVKFSELRHATMTPRTIPSTKLLSTAASTVSLRLAMTVRTKLRALPNAAIH